MLSNKHIKELKKIVHGDIELNVSMKNHTSFRIGGKVSVMLFPREMTDLVEAICYLKKYGIKYYIIGAGTNILVTDKDIDYVVLKLGSNFNNVTVREDRIIAYGGASINNVCIQAYNNGLSGMEDAFGIPGTIGGAVIMNAGAYNFEMSKVLGSVIALVDGKIKVFDNIKFGYRYSEFQDYANIVILQVEILLHSGNKPDIYARMQEVMNIRKDTQPLDKPSAGSIFKRLDGLIVSKEIERLGLKGEAIGGAKVSEKHAGFIINNGGASYTDVVELIDKIKDKFREIYDIELVEEIKYLGE